MASLLMKTNGPCSWSNYYVDYPIYEIKVPSLSWGGYFIHKAGC